MDIGEGGLELVAPVEREVTLVGKHGVTPHREAVRCSPAYSAMRMPMRAVEAWARLTVVGPPPSPERTTSSARVGA